MSGAVAQLVRAPACHAGGCGFDSRPLRHSLIRKAHQFGALFWVYTKVWGVYTKVWGVYTKVWGVYTKVWGEACFFKLLCYLTALSDHA